MNKDKRNNIQLLGTLNNADESGIIANANQVYDANEDKSTQDVSKEHKERIETLETKESSMQTTLENITKTGEASAASNVTYNHNDSQLDASNVQQAIDEVRKRSNYNDGENIIDFNTIHKIEDNTEFIVAETDTEGRLLESIDVDGKKKFYGDVEIVGELTNKDIAQIKHNLDEKEEKGVAKTLANDVKNDVEKKIDFGNKVYPTDINKLQDTEYISVAIDILGHIYEAWGIDGIKCFFAPIKVQDTLLKQLDTEFIKVDLTQDKKVLGAWKEDGDYFFGAGVPSQIQREIKNSKEEVLYEIKKNYATKDNDKEVEDYLSQSDLVYWLKGYGIINKSINKSLVLLHFSDIHGDKIAFDRIVEFYQKYKKYFSDCICTGDMVKYEWNSGFDYWIENQNANKILLALGNHDPNDTTKDSSWTGRWYQHNAEECYGRYFKNISYWNVTQPQVNGVTQKVCYYYKDYPTQKIRMIVLDGMNWNNAHEDTAQEDWFNTTLNEANQKGYSVLIVSHFMAEEGILNHYNNFDAYYVNMNYLSNESQSSSVGFGFLSSKVPKAVDNFKKSGGDFIAYIGGHTHIDIFRNLKSYPEQVQICVANAGMNEHTGTDNECYLQRHEGTTSQNLFNILNINPSIGTISILRVGANYDSIGRHLGSIVYDYKNNKILTQN